MISSNILNFLAELSKNNNKAWYQQNKETYATAKHDFELVVGLLIHEIASFDKDIGTLMPKDCIFRIFRDVRFSKDKTPYKTNFGAYMAKGGKKSGYAGYYLHIEPGNYFLAGGIYMPMPPVLRSIRDDIFHNIDEFKGIIESAEFKKYFGQVWGSKLKSPPKGYSKDFKDIELLKFKDYNLLHELSLEQITSSNFMNNAIKVYKAMIPFNRFLNQAVENVV